MGNSAPPMSNSLCSAEVGGHILLSMLEGQSRKKQPSRDTGENIYVELQKEHSGIGTASISAFMYHVAKVSSIQLNIYNWLDYSNQAPRGTMPVACVLSDCSGQLEVAH